MRNHARMTRLFFALLAFCFLLEGISSATKKPPLKPININTANSEELQQVPGIGPATADKILQMRKSYGAFKSVDDLLSIRGIGTFEGTVGLTHLQDFVGGCQTNSRDLL